MENTPIKPVIVEVYGRHLCVVPLPSESAQPPQGKTRIELLELAAKGKLFGSFTAQIIDLKNLPAAAKPLENPPLPTEVAYWLSAVFGQAVYIQSLIPNLAPLASARDDNSQQVQNHLA